MTVKMQGGISPTREISGEGPCIPGHCEATQPQLSFCWSPPRKSNPGPGLQAWGIDVA